MVLAVVAAGLGLVSAAPATSPQRGVEPAVTERTGFEWVAWGSAGRRPVMLGAAARGRTVRVRVGRRIDVRLPAQFDPPVSGGRVLARRRSAGGYPSGRPSFTEFTAARPGRDRITATTDYPCFHTTPRCLVATQVWSVLVIVSR
jgi:hypothetical protein